MATKINNSVIVNYTYGGSNISGEPSYCSVSTYIDRVRIVKSICDEEVQLDDYIYYIITVSIYDEDKTNLLITDILNEELSYVYNSAKLRLNNSNVEEEITPTVTLVSNREKLDFIIPLIKQGEIATIRFAVKADSILPSSDNLSNSAIVTIKSGVTLNSNEVISKYSYSNVKIKKIMPDFVFCGSNIPLTFILDNYGNEVVSNIELIDDLNNFDNNVSIGIQGNLRDNIVLNGQELPQSIIPTFENGILRITGITIPSATISQDNTIIPATIIIKIKGIVICS